MINCRENVPINKNVCALIKMKIVYAFMKTNISDLNRINALNTLEQKR